MTIQEKLKSKKLILASKSPRRKELLASIGVEFEQRTKEIEEIYPEGLSNSEIVTYLSQLKAKAFLPELKNNEIIITSDTIVCIDNKILGKPKNTAEATIMLQLLSGKAHQVITGVSLSSTKKTITFYDTTNVFFKSLSDEEISFYIQNFRPFDKAGAYGIQEWIGQIGISKIEGSYFTVMGLPTHRIYEELMLF